MATPVTLPSRCPAQKPSAPKGLCIFDVDGTLTAGEFPAHVNARPPVQACIDAGWDVGVATASSRTWEDVCELVDGKYQAKGGHGIAGGWMTDAMCANMGKNHFLTFNSNDAMYGGQPIDPKYGSIKSISGTPGGKKALLTGGIVADCFPGVPVILFDNDPNWGREAMLYTPEQFAKTVTNPPAKGVDNAYCMLGYDKSTGSCTSTCAGAVNVIDCKQWQDGTAIPAILSKE